MARPTDGTLLAMAALGTLGALAVTRRGSLAKSQLAPLQRRLVHLARSLSADPEAAIRAQDIVIHALRGGRNQDGSLGSPVGQLLSDIRHMKGPSAGLDVYLDLVTGQIETNSHFTGVDLAVRSRYDKLTDWVGREVRRILKAQRAGKLKGRELHEVIVASGQTPMSSQEKRALYVFGAMTRGLSRVADWFSVANPDLGQMTWNQAKRASDVWHKDQERLSRAAGVLPGVVEYVFPDDGSTLHRLTGRQQLITEGKALGHCVGTSRMYWDAVVRGTHAIYSLRDADGIPEWTFEVKLDESGQPERVLQVKGPSDRLPNSRSDCRKIGIVLADVFGLPNPRSAGDLHGCIGEINRLLDERGAVDRVD